MKHLTKLLFQVGGRGNRRAVEHARGYSHGTCAVRRTGPAKVAVRRLVQ